MMYNVLYININDKGRTNPLRTYVKRKNVLSVLVYHWIMTLRIVVDLIWWFIMAVCMCGVMARPLYVLFTGCCCVCVRVCV